MLKYIFSVFASVLFISAMAQSPQILNYQGVARNGFGNPLQNRSMTLRINIRNGGSNGPIVYSETRSVTTNSGGLYAVQIGSSGATTTIGTIAAINWQVGTKFLQVELDPESGTNFIDMGTTQLVSVPYALSAGASPPVGAAGGDLSGTFPNPTVANGSINTNKLADASVTTSKLADASVTDAKIVGVSGSKVTGNITGNAANVTGTVAVATGGTGATTATAARTNLGLGNVDNTSDLNKPISTATQTALDLKENTSNKSSVTTLGTSDALYPTQNAVKTYVDNQIISGATPDATATVKGKLQLAGDLAGTATSPVVAAGAISTAKLADASVSTSKLADASVTDAKIVGVSGSKVTGNITGNAANVTGTVAVATGGTGATTATAARTNLGLGNVDNTSDLNKPISTATQTALDLKENTSNKSSVTTLGTSDALYPTQNAVKTYVDNQIISGATPDATATVKGKLQLAGDLAGTATSPVVAAGAISTAKLADASVTDAKIVGVSGSKVTGNITGNAANVTGTVAVATGGTGATTATAARTNLGLGNIDNTSDLNKPISTATQTALDLKENTSNKSSVTTLGTSDAFYPTQNAVKTYVDNRVNSISSINTLNGISSATQTFGVGSSGSDITIASTGSTHTFNIPSASTTARGVVTTGAQTFAGSKTFSSDINVNGVKIGRGLGNNDQNVAIGADALAAGTGTRNTAVGYGSMRSYNGTSFDNNTSVGYFNLQVLTSGSGNTSVGAESMMALTTGTQNTSVGNQSLINTTGNNNVGIGKRAGQTISSGSQNTIVGTDADVSVATLSNATAIGYGATVDANNRIQLGNTSVNNVKTSGSITAGAVTYPNTDGTANQVLTTNGSGVASWATTNSGATTVGSINGSSTANGATITSGVLKLSPADGSNGGIITTGVQTIAGDKNFTNNINVNQIRIGIPNTGSQNTMFGNASFAYGSPGSNNTALGFFTLSSLMNSGNEGNDNTAVGTNALRQGGVTPNGSRNTAVGSAAMSNALGSFDNVAVGVNTLNAATGGNNTAVGNYALQNTSTAIENVGLGIYSLHNASSGRYNTAVGAYSMYNNITGDVNTSIGHKSLFSNSTGRYNTSIGVQSQESNITGSQNTAIGVAAIDQIITGDNNAVLGAFAGRHFGANPAFLVDRNTVMNNSVLIGADARPLLDNANNEIVIGYNAVGNGSNTIQLGNTSITNVKTAGTITAGAVTYPNTDGTANQVLTTNGSGVASWGNIVPAGKRYVTTISGPIITSNYTPGDIVYEQSSGTYYFFKAPNQNSIGFNNTNSYYSFFDFGKNVIKITPTLTANITSITLTLHDANNTIFSLYSSLTACSTGPYNNPIATVDPSNILGSSVANSGSGDVTFTFSTPIPVTANTTYYLTVSSAANTLHAIAVRTGVNDPNFSISYGTCTINQAVPGMKITYSSYSTL